MEIERIEEEDKKVFQPVVLKITLMTPDEVRLFKALANAPKKVLSAFMTSAGQKVGVDTMLRLYDSLSFLSGALEDE